MRLSRTFATITTITLLFLVACGSAQDKDGRSLDEITTTIEKAGFTCEKTERYPDSISQAGQCRSNNDKYLILTVSQWNDVEAREQLYAHKLPTMCDDAYIKDKVRWSTSGSWSLVVGSSKAKDFKVLDEVTGMLGFEPHEKACQ